MRYVVTYTANSCDEHDCDSIYHTHKFSRTFRDKIDALHFLGECTSNHKDLHAIEEPVETEETETLKTFVDHEGSLSCGLDTPSITWIRTCSLSIQNPKRSPFLD